MKNLLKQFLASRAWRKFAAHWMAYFTFRMFGWPKFPKSKYFEIKKLAEAKRDESGILAFVSVDRFILNYQINHFLTKCKWGHAGYVYWGEDNELRIKQMINSGLDDCYLLDLFGEIDGYALLWIPLKDLPIVLKRVTKLDSVKDKIRYDYALTLDPEVLSWIDSEKEINKLIYLYCSEMVYLLVNKLTSFEPHEIMGQKVFEPDNLYNASQILFEEIY